MGVAVNGMLDILDAQTSCNLHQHHHCLMCVRVGVRLCTCVRACVSVRVREPLGAFVFVVSSQALPCNFSYIFLSA